MITIINFKTYKQGRDVLRLVKELERVDKNIIVGVQPTDVAPISKLTKLKVFIQHADYFSPGRYTGYIIPESVKEQGAKGVFLNHSEHQIPFDVLKESVKRCNEVGLQTAVFAPNLRKAKKIKKLNPDYLIIEPPKLVSGNISVSEAKPKMIKKISEKIGRNFIVGAGIKNSKDVKKALELGASGIAVSSAITKSKNPGKVLKELLNY